MIFGHYRVPQVETIPRALSVEELKEKVKDIHILGIRSKTKVTAEVLDAAKRLLCVGCFCIGTVRTIETG